MTPFTQRGCFSFPDHWSSVKKRNKQSVMHQFLCLSRNYTAWMIVFMINTTLPDWIAYTFLMTEALTKYFQQRVCRSIDASSKRSNSGKMADQKLPDSPGCRGRKFSDYNTDEKTCINLLSPILSWTMGPETCYWGSGQAATLCSINITTVCSLNDSQILSHLNIYW